MHRRIAVDLACRGLEDLGARALGQPQHVDGAVHTGLGRLHRIVLVVDRRGRTGEVVDLVDLDIEREGHVVTHQLEARIVEARHDVLLGAGEVVVDAQHVVARRQQTLAEMRTEEARAPVTNTRLLMFPRKAPLNSPGAALEDRTLEITPKALNMPPLRPGWDGPRHPRKSMSIEIKSLADIVRRHAAERPDAATLVHGGRKSAIQSSGWLSALLS
jgi:hypothetical protein